SGAAALKYLAAYVSRTALGNQRILRDEGGRITFQYRASGERAWRTLTLAAPEFLRRFLQHVLPTGFARVRYYGWLAAAAKNRWQRILALLDWQAPARIVTPQPPPVCPCCGGHLSWLGTLARGPP
ncbi:MAG: transposase, partial [Terriglobales bacterium]